MRFTVIAAAAFEYEAIQASSAHSLVDEYIEFGVGVLESMYQISSILDRITGRNIIYVGSAGIIGTFADPLLVSVARVEWMPTGDRLGLAYSVPKHETILLDRPSALNIGASLDKAPCICGPSVSVDNGSTVGRFVGYLENIELYGVAKKIMPVAGSFEALLGISNAVGPKSHEDWKRNFQACAKLTAEHLSQIFGKV